MANMGENSNFNLRIIGSKKNKPKKNIKEAIKLGQVLGSFLPWLRREEITNVDNLRTLVTDVHTCLMRATRNILHIWFATT